MTKVFSLMAWIKNYAVKISSDFAEFVDYCVYEEHIQSWVSNNLSKAEVKRELQHMFLDYEEQRKYLASLL